MPNNNSFENTVNLVDLIKLLYKIVIQFGLYTQKSNKSLDNYLNVITQSLKNGGELNQLTPDLQAMSKTLGHLIRTKQQFYNHPSLIDYLSYRSKIDKDSKLSNILQSLSNNELPHEEQLFAELDSLLIKTQPNNHSGDAVDDFQKKNLFLNRLSCLLDEIVVPIQYKQQLATLKKRCSCKSINEQTYNEIVETAISLLIKIRNNTQLEQLNISDILSGITEQLGHIEEKAQQISNNNQSSFTNRSEFSQELRDQVDNILQSTNQASELMSLQDSITHLIENVKDKIQAHQQSEDLLQISVQQQLQDVTQKLQDTEAEALLLRNQLQLAYNLALQDTLTGLANRLAYDQRIDYENKRWQRIQQPLSLIVWDIDYFKKINDQYGHKSGDKALISIAHIIITNSRSSDFVARYGGEEFVMLLPNTYAKEAFELADKIRGQIDNANFNTNNDIIKITVSAGIHQFMATDTTESAFEQADKALYYAKLHGRNQCKLSNDLLTIANHPE